MPSASSQVPQSSQDALIQFLGILWDSCQGTLGFGDRVAQGGQGIDNVGVRGCEWLACVKSAVLVIDNISYT